MKNLLLVVLLSISVQAGSLMQAQKALETNDFEKAIKILKTLVKKNDPQAQFEMGILYFYAKGVEVDYEKAFSLFVKSANQNYANAQITLASKYCMGDHIKKDLTKCAYWADLARQNDKNVSRMWNNFELDNYFPAKKENAD